MKMMLRGRDCTKISVCLICGSRSLEILCRLFSRYCPQYFHKVAICQDCGHIQIYPLFNEKEFTIINDKFFNRKYLTGGKQNPNNIKKVSQLDKKLSQYLTSGMRVLDVGPGEAWAMDYFHAKGCDYSSIEPVVSFANSIRERGGKVIGESLFTEYERYENYFDIVIFRHVLEHMLNPYEALLKLKYFLATDGMIYLVLPNASTPSIEKGFRTSYLRPVHISYFCEGNVLRLAESVGLAPVSVHTSEEICCLLKNNEVGVSKLKYVNFYNQQKAIFRQKLREAFYKDLGKICKIYIRGLF